MIGSGAVSILVSESRDMTYIVFPDGHNVLLRHSRASHAFDVGDGHVAHDLAGDIAHGAVPAQSH